MREVFRAVGCPLVHFALHFNHLLGESLLLKNGSILIHSSNGQSIVGIVLRNVEQAEGDRLHGFSFLPVFRAASY